MLELLESLHKHIVRDTTTLLTKMHLSTLSLPKRGKDRKHSASRQKLNLSPRSGSSRERIMALLPANVGLHPMRTGKCVARFVLLIVRQLLSHQLENRLIFNRHFDPR